MLQEILLDFYIDDIYYDSYSVLNVVNYFKKNKFDGVYGDLEYVKKDNIDKFCEIGKVVNFIQDY